ncbi:unnamed protein product, partial [marine sediment metagenome]
QVAEIIRPRRVRSRAVPDLPTVTNPLVIQQQALRQRYLVAADAAVGELQRGVEISIRFQQEDERYRAKLAVDANRLGDVMSVNGSHFYFGRSGSANQYTTEEAAAMEARIKRNIAKANLLTEFSTPARFSSFPR